MREPSTDPLALTYLDAAAAGDLEVVTAALAQGVDKDAVDRDEASAILRAARGGHMAVVDALIAAGVDINQQDQTCFNPFILGCITNNLELVKKMVEAGTDVRVLTRFGGNGLTPAAEKGHVEVVRYLVENTRVNINLTNTLGWTALIEAITLNDGGPAQQEIVRLLLDNGGKPGMTDEFGVTPLELAERKGYTEIADIIRGHL